MATATRRDDHIPYPSLASFRPRSDRAQPRFWLVGSTLRSANAIQQSGLDRAMLIGVVRSRRSKRSRSDRRDCAGPAASVRVPGPADADRQPRPVIVARGRVRPWSFSQWPCPTADSFCPERHRTQIESARSAALPGARAGERPSVGISTLDYKTQLLLPAGDHPSAYLRRGSDTVCGESPLCAAPCPYGERPLRVVVGRRSLAA